MSSFVVNPSFTPTRGIDLSPTLGRRKKSPPIGDTVSRGREVTSKK